jgi:hypothetical protein
MKRQRRCINGDDIADIKEDIRVCTSASTDWSSLYKDASMPKVSSLTQLQGALALGLTGFPLPRSALSGFL